MEKVERFGKKNLPTPTEPKPRLLKIFMKDFSSRKQILSKAVTLRDSENEDVKTNVFIRPDQTQKQQVESKNLRAQLKLVREENPNKRYKIKRGAITELIAEETVYT